METLDLIKILGVLALLAAGNLILEFSAGSLPPVRSPAGLLKFLVNLPFLLGLGLSGLSTILYISVLQRVPLSQVYPMMATNYVLVPLLSLAIRRERPSGRLAIGLVLLVAGLYFIVTDYS
ncbi:MAG: 4-amino-4-deoxy-L-arabinose-phospho-UDP flippase [Alphaproteobacteria bacterium]|nr:4-amino-4-deoxy-L-arabinose-phospho-UDP flippase [Alphaproteobacteria bacterium]